MIATLATAPFSFEAEAPAAVEVIVFHQPDKKRYLVSLINEQEQPPPIPVLDTVVRVRTDDKKPVGAALLPNEEPLPFTIRGDYTEIVVPRLDIFCMLMLAYG
jgi:hypothetical protein